MNHFDSNKIRLFLSGGIFILVAIYLIFGREEQSQQKKPLLVKVEQVKQQDLTEKLDLIGSVVAFESVAIKSRLDSQIVDVFIKDGAFVKKDDKLFQLDNRYLDAQLKEAEANKESNKSEIVRAERQYNRDIQLSKKGVTTKEQFDRSTQAYDAAKAALAATEAKISSLATQISYADIRSPIDGVVGTIQITRGNIVKANDTEALAVINTLDPIYVDIPLPQRYFWLYKKHAKEIKVTVKTSEGRDLKIGEITSIQNAFDVNSRTLTLRAKMANADHQLWPGMLVDVQLDVRKEPGATVIPVKAMLRTQKGEQVFKIVNNVAALIPVEVLFTVADLAAVKADLKANDLVVVEGGFNIREGDKVEIVEGAHS